ncbi:MAG: right-handed parallel beta-helix repeat-containing protein [Lachnospiraceae bacterium]|nr:right-handed parallel beta-helix repeat-containing protein [Lachnospiraceae bacterium]
MHHLLKSEENTMDASVSILFLIILAIMTQHLVSWAGSILHEVANEETHYAVFTFRDDRNMPMTTNILMNLCIPNVLMIFIFMFSQKFHLPYVEKYLLLYVISFFVYRMLLICVILRRKEMYSFLYEWAMTFAGICLALFLIRFFLSTEKNVFITASELREELWFVILIILYQFFKQILDKKVLQNNVLKKDQISRYIIHKFQKFYNRYQHLLSLSLQNRDLCIFLYSIMIFEDYNRGPVARSFERLKTRMGKSATTGIMQVKSNTPLSNEESVIKFYNWLEEAAGGYTQFGMDDARVFDLAWQYNNDNAYAQSVVYIYNCLFQYIDEVPKYRKTFFMRTTYDGLSDLPEAGIFPYRLVTCDSMDAFCQTINCNTYINLEKGIYCIQDITQPTLCAKLEPVVGGMELTIYNIENMHIHANCSSLTVDARYATVLSWKNCKNIVIEHLTLGHAPAPGECTGAVLQFENCSNITVKHLELYGCGTYGIVCLNGNITIENCKIHHCSYGGILLNRSNCVIDHTEIYDCEDTFESIIDAIDSNVIMSCSTICNCSSQSHILHSSNASFICRDVLIRGCNAALEITNLEQKNGIHEQDNQMKAPTPFQSD